MCKHQSGGMSKSSATNPSCGFSQNSASVHCNTSSINNCTSRCKSERCHSINNSGKEISNFYSEKMAVGSHGDSSSSSDKGYDTEQAEIQCTIQQSGKNDDKEKVFEKWNAHSNVDCGDYEDDAISENSPMLQNQDVLHALPSSSSWHNYQLSLQSPDFTKSISQNSVPGNHNWTTASLHTSSHNLNIIADSDTKSANNYLKLQEELEQEPLFRPNHTNALPNSDNNLVDVSSDDNTSQYSPSRSSSLVQNWLFPKQCILDEVFVHKTYIPKKVTSINSNANLQTQSNAENESLVKSSNSDLSIRLSMKAAPMEFSPDTIVLQRRSSAHWEVSSIRSTSNEIHCRSFSLSPTVNFAMFETESSSEADNPHTISSFQGNSNYVRPEGQLTEIAVHPSVLPGSSSTTRLSLASSFSDFSSPICKICHMVGREGDPLISPCRCSGTMQFIHCGCLMKWLEISSKRSRKPPSCELCQYQYHWHKKFKVRHWQFPHCSRKDVTLHLVFFLSVLVMIACATITILCFKQDKGTKIDPDRTELTHSEIITLICGVLFFLAFFVGMYVEIKARNTIYKLLVKFVYLNQQWYIDEYNKKENITISV